MKLFCIIICTIALLKYIQYTAELMYMIIDDMKERRNKDEPTQGI